MTSAPSSRNRITVTQYSRSSQPSATRTTILLPLSFTSLLSLKLPSMLRFFRGPTSSFLLGPLRRPRRLCPPSIPGTKRLLRTPNRANQQDADEQREPSCPEPFTLWLPRRRKI